MRFKVECTDDGAEDSSSQEDEPEVEILDNSTPKCTPKVIDKTKYPASISIYKQDIQELEWVPIEKPLDLSVETERFSSGGFRDAFLGVGPGKQKWVIKEYNDSARHSIIEALQSNVETHTRKQIQMHSAARHLAKFFSIKAPKAYGECFKFNHAYYKVYNGKAVNVEEFADGSFRKYINNDGKICKEADCCSASLKAIFEKAECFVHFSYVHSSEKLMLLDLQWSQYHLYDPEIATKELQSADFEVYFCVAHVRDALRMSGQCNGVFF